MVFAKNEFQSVLQMYRDNLHLSYWNRCREPFLPAGVVDPEKKRKIMEKSSFAF
jgi:hypothetical protein